MAPFEDRFEPYLVTERARLGVIKHAANGASVEVLLNIIRSHVTLDPADLRRTADIVERLGAIGILLKTIDRDWAVGELRVTDEDVDDIVEKIKGTLEILDEKKK